MAWRRLGDVDTLQEMEEVERAEGVDMAGL